MTIGLFSKIRSTTGKIKVNCTPSNNEERIIKIMATPKIPWWPLRNYNNFK
jgi:hypothetical protein